MEGLKRGDVVVVAPQGDYGKPRPADKPYTVAREKIGGRIGRLDEQTLLQVNRSMMIWLGLP